MKPCPFCHMPADRILHQNDHLIVIRDGYPISPGHTLIIPKRHTGSFFDLSPDEHQAITQALYQSKTQLDREFHPAGYNIGINDGPAAGQTVPHLHVHLIPRYDGDRKDPRGGIRWIIPEKAVYWQDD